MADRVTEIQNLQRQIETLHDLLQQSNDACRTTERERMQADARREAAEKALVRERQAWYDNSQRMREQLQAALDKAQSKSGLLSFRRKPSQPSPSGRRDTMDDDMRAAQEATAMLKTVLQPMEDELAALRLAVHGGTASETASLQDAVAALRRRTADLEVQLDVANAQKEAMKREVETLNMQLQTERTAQAELQLTWQRANEQFLEESMMKNETIRLLQAGVPLRSDASAEECVECKLLKARLAEERETRSSQLDARIANLKSQHEREIKTLKDNAAAVASSLESEVRLQRMQLVAFEERIAAMSATAREPGRAVRCAMCQNYELQLQERIDANRELAAAADHDRATLAAQVQRAEESLGAQAARHAAHVAEIMAQLAQIHAENLLAVQREHEATLDTLVQGLDAATAQQHELVGRVTALREALNRAEAAKTHETTRLRRALEDMARSLHRERGLRSGPSTEPLASAGWSEASPTRSRAASAPDASDGPVDTSEVFVATPEVSRHSAALPSTPLPAAALMPPVPREDEEADDGTEASVALLQAQLARLGGELAAARVQLDAGVARQAEDASALAEARSRAAALDQAREKLEAELASVKQKAKEVMLALQAELADTRSKCGQLEAQVAELVAKGKDSARVLKELTFVNQALMMDIENLKQASAQPPPLPLPADPVSATVSDAPTPEAAHDAVESAAAAAPVDAVDAEKEDKDTNGVEESAVAARSESEEA
eukprot:m.14175 g.14175  ORF g.14175 m.14175 type:complete len:729 (+) comp6350_c0_seq2:132-2318(+)